MATIPELIPGELLFFAPCQAGLKHPILTGRRKPGELRNSEDIGASFMLTLQRQFLRRGITSCLLVAAIGACVFFPVTVSAGPEKNADQTIPSIETKTVKYTRVDGYFPFYWDSTTGDIYLEIPALGAEFLYVNSLRTGLGSNPVGLDRGQLGSERVVRFMRRGPKVLLLQRNLNFRAITDDQDEQRAVEESFAQSVLWGGEVAAQTAGRILVKFTDFLIRDAHKVIQRLERSGQGSFSLDSKRSLVDIERCKAFPKNTELEALLTFTSKKPGGLVRETTPTPEAVTLWQRHSFVQLPDDEYQPRVFDPRAGLFYIEYADYATPLDEPLLKKYIARHRLKKQNAADGSSAPVEPIVYYVDRGAPEPVRQALIDGASWWNEAFVAAGFQNAFRVEILPEGADPLDVRYNVIQWVHRSTRGWSYGGSVIDPRTGEIIKGHVSLGSLRVRQDRLLIEGLSPFYGSSGGAGGFCEIGSAPDPAMFTAFDPFIEPTEIALARIRQLAAHEVGHTLGLAHNFAASSYGRESVMDYPAPFVSVRSDSSLDLSAAYDTGIGEWDKIAIRYGYSVYPDEETERAELEWIVDESIRRKLLFITDKDSRSPGSAHPLASLWDNGADPVSELSRVMRVREIGLNAFGADNIETGRPMAELENTLTPLYLSHRYQIAATAKSLGGVYYSYQVRGDHQQAPRPVDVSAQRGALSALMATLTPAALELPDHVRDLVPPQPFGYGDERELFNGRMGAVFDPQSLIEVAARMTVGAILQYQRAERMDFQSNELGVGLSFPDALNSLIDYYGKSSDPASAHSRRIVEQVILAEVIKLIENENASASVRAEALAGANRLRNRCGELLRRGDRADSSHYAALLDTIDRFMSRPHHPAKAPSELGSPPGSPIGSPNQ